MDYIRLSGIISIDKNKQRNKCAYFCRLKTNPVNEKKT
jgi:hypothetical protein